MAALTAVLAETDSDVLVAEVESAEAGAAPAVVQATAAPKPAPSVSNPARALLTLLAARQVQGVSSGSVRYNGRPATAGTAQAVLSVV